jgi:hypothetical protein
MRLVLYSDGTEEAYFKQRKIWAVPAKEERIAMGAIARGTEFVLEPWRIAPSLVRSPMYTWRFEINIVACSSQ